MQSAQFCRMMNLQVCMSLIVCLSPGAGNPKQCGGYLRIVGEFVRIPKIAIEGSGVWKLREVFGNCECKNREEGNLLTMEGRALRCRGREVCRRFALQTTHHPAPSHLLRRVLLHSSQLLKWVMSMNVHPPACTVHVRLVPQRPPAIEFAQRKEENGHQIVLGAVWTQKKVSYPLPFRVWHARLTF